MLSQKTTIAEPSPSSIAMTSHLVSLCGFNIVLLGKAPNPLPVIEAARELTLDIADTSIGVIVYFADLTSPLKLCSSLSPRVV